MTVPFSMNQSVKPSSVFIICLVTDKKYRKMGGEEGLKSAVKKSGNQTISIAQLQVEELLGDSDDFEGNLKHFMNRHTKQCNELEPSLADQQIILVHKYSDFYKSKIERDRLHKLRSWLHEVTGLIKVLDDPEKIDILFDRVKTGHLAQKLCESEGFEARGLQWPVFTEQCDFEGLSVPVIVKPIDACSTDESHWMTLICEAPSNFKHQLIFPQKSLVQQFYEHYGILYKVYVIGSEVIEIVALPSISAADHSEAPIYRFNTHKFKASEGSLSPAKLCEATRRLEPHKPLILEFTRRLKRELGLTWFGIDVIIPENSLKVAVIDVNYMPGFDGIKELSDKLIKAILE